MRQQILNTYNKKEMKNIKILLKICSPCQSSVDYGTTQITEHAQKLSVSDSVFKLIRSVKYVDTMAIRKKNWEQKTN